MLVLWISLVLDLDLDLDLFGSASGFSWITLDL
jgi:hypothetical protein